VIGLVSWTPRLPPALPALAGSAIGGCTSFASAWLTQQRAAVRTRIHLRCGRGRERNIWLALRLSGSGTTNRPPAQRLFMFFISYLFILFAALLADHGSDPQLPAKHGRLVAQIEPRPDRILAPHESVTVLVDEV
jgi:hypothetical protein